MPYGRPFAFRDKKTGAILSFPRNLTNGLIRCIEQDDESFYIGGTFSRALPDLSSHLGRFNSITGSFQKYNNIEAFDNETRWAVLDSDTLYVSGGFKSYNKTVVHGIAKINVNTGVIDTNFDTADAFIPAPSSGYDRPFVVDETSIYIIGNFTSYKGVPRQNIVKISKVDASIDLTFDPGTGFNTGASLSSSAITQDATHLYISGTFTSYNGVTRNNIIKISKVTGQPDLTFDTSVGPNSGVGALLLDGNDLYIGGGFTTYNGITRQRIAKISKIDASLDPTFDTVIGSGSSIMSIIKDGTSLFLGGNFTTYKGFTRRYLAKISATDASLDATFDPGATGPNNYVKTLALDGSSLYVGGTFTSYQGTAAYYLTKISTTDASKDASFDTSAVILNGWIWKIIVSNGKIYAAGRIECVGGTVANNLLKLKKSDFSLDSYFNTSIGPNSGVYSILLDSPGIMYISGEFTSYNGTSATRIAKISTSTASLDPSFDTTTGAAGTVWDMAGDATSIYIGGEFTSYKGTTRQRIAKISKTDASLDATFDSSVGITWGSYIMSLYVDDNYVYGFGNFFAYKNITRTSIFKISKINASLQDTLNTPFLAGGSSSTYTSHVIEEDGYFYLGGNFNGVSKLAGKLARFDAITAEDCPIQGILTGFSGGQINCMTKEDNYLYVGGTFTSYTGTAVQRIAKIDVTNGNLDVTFNTTSGPNADVYAMALDSSGLYIGGNFTTYKGSSAKYLVKINKTSAAIDSTFNTSTSGCNLNGRVNAIALDGNKLYIGGGFSTVVGDSYNPYYVKGYLATLSTTTAALDLSIDRPINVGKPGGATVNSIILDATNIYVGGNFDYTMESNRGLARIDTTSGNSYKFSEILNGFGCTIPSNTFSVYTVVQDEDSLYMGGLFTSYSGVTRNHIVKVNKETGALDTQFNPNGTFLSATDSSTKVYSLALDGDNLYVGGAFTTYSGIACQGGLAKVSKYTGAPDLTFNTSVGFWNTSSNGPGTVQSLLVEDSYLVVGGDFMRYKNVPRWQIAKLSKTDASLIAHSAVLPMALSGYPTSLKSDSTSIYAAGWFTYTLNLNRGFARLDKDTASDQKLSQIFEGFAGTVRCFVQDGSDLYVGGSFTAYKNSTAINLAKINVATGVLDATFNTSTSSDGTIFAIGLDASGVYIAGSFTSYKGTTRQRIAKVSKTDASLDATFDAATGANGDVLTMSSDTTHLYIAGSFTSYKGTTRQRIAKVSKTDASLDATFDAATGASSTINTILIDGSYLYIGGSFTSYKSTTRQYIAKISTTNAALDATFDSASGASSSISAICIDGSYLYIAGNFTTYKGTARVRLAKISTTSAALDATFDTASGANGVVTCLACDASGLYVGGQFLQYKSVSRPYMCKVSKTDASVIAGFVTTAPGFTDYVYCLLLDGSYLYVGGQFGFFGGTAAQRVIKFNKSDESIDATFNTVSGADAGGVYDMLLEDNYLYLCGTFANYKGVPRKYLAKISATDASLDLTFDPTTSTSSEVRSLTMDTDGLYLLGFFTTYKGVPSRSIVKVSKTTAEKDPIFISLPGGDYYLNKAVIDNGYLYIVGNFSLYGGKLSSNIAKFNRTTQIVDSIFDSSNGFDSQVYTLTVDDSAIYVGGWFTAYRGTTRRKLAKLSKVTGNLDLIFDTSVGPGAGSLSIRGIELGPDNTLYIAGNFYTWNDTIRRSLAKISRTTAALDSSFNSIIAVPDPSSMTIYSLIYDGTHIYIGGDFNIAGGRIAGKLVKLNKLDYSIDTSFDTSYGFEPSSSEWIMGIAIDENYVYAIGSLSKFKNNTVSNLIKISKTDAILDTNFNVVLGPDYNYYLAPILVNNNFIYFGGRFSYFRGNRVLYASRANKITGQIA